MKQVIIEKDDSQKRLDKFLSKAFPLLPVSHIYRALRLKRIKVNGGRAAPGYMLAEGDNIELYINDELLDIPKKNEIYKFANKPLDIIYEDENILLLNKPHGLLCHSEEKGDIDTLINRVLFYLGASSSMSFMPALCNRIDRNTTGIVIAAKNAGALRIMNEKIKNREVKKHYLCIAHGIFQNKNGVYTDFLEKDSDKNRVFIKTRKNAANKTIITKYRVLSENNRLSLLEVELVTGRTHQIRAHLAFHGHPLLGDTKYGTNKQNVGVELKSQALMSYKIKFDFSGESGLLSYLNSKSFEIRDTWVSEYFKSL